MGKGIPGIRRYGERHSRGTELWGERHSRDREV